MTAEEKKTIFNLVKTASSSLNGWQDPFFDREFTFSDDEEMTSPLLQPQSASQSTTEAQIASNSQSTPDSQISQPSLQSESSQSPVENPSSKEETLASIARKIAVCTRCPLAKSRNNTVPGEGVLNPDVVVVGEGPGYEEDVNGRPFVGPAGQLLDKMLASIKLDRTRNCYIANIVKCRPPQNRVPYSEEAQACESFLTAQILALKPKMILCVGSTACKNLLKTADGVNKLRGSFYDWNGICVAVTYHPSALLRDETLKRPAWEDLKLARSHLCTLSPSYKALVEES